MLELPSKRKKLPVPNLEKLSSIFGSDGKSEPISAREAGRQRLKQVTRREKSDADATGKFLQHSSEMLDRIRFRSPANK